MSKKDISTSFSSIGSHWNLLKDFCRAVCDIDGQELQGKLEDINQQLKEIAQMNKIDRKII